MHNSNNINIASEERLETSLPAKGKKEISGSKKDAKLKMLIPLVVVLICSVIAIFMFFSAMKGANKLEGRFDLSQSAGNSYIELDSNHVYTMCVDGESTSGRWTINGSKIQFESMNTVTEARIIDRKYIVLENSDFLVGSVPTDVAAFDAEVISDEGVAYGFKSDGSYYIVEDGRNTQLGSYITDGYFIIVTTDTGTTTYLNCGDGITSAFYQAS